MLRTIWIPIDDSLTLSLKKYALLKYILWRTRDVVLQVDDERRNLNIFGFNRF